MAENDTKTRNVILWTSQIEGLDELSRKRGGASINALIREAVNRLLEHEGFHTDAVTDDVDSDR